MGEPQDLCCHASEAALLEDVVVGLQLVAARRASAVATEPAERARPDHEDYGENTENHTQTIPVKTSSRNYYFPHDFNVNKS